MKAQRNHSGGAGTAVKVAYRTVKIDGLDIFYREAGPKNGNVVLLLHGFPTSSHMFRNLIRRWLTSSTWLHRTIPATVTARCRPWTSLSTPSTIWLM